jgi:hypothetical protein
MLARNAIEPNVFYEPWMFLPAVEAFDRDKPLCCVFVNRRDPGSPEPLLSGFLPTARGNRIKRLPMRTLRSWQHTYALLCTPLVHRDFSRETLRAMFDWFATESQCSLVEWPMIHGEGAFHQAFLDVLNERRTSSFVNETFNRALIRRGVSAEAYCELATNRESRREWRR